MRIRFLGAAGDVTGSAYQVLTKEASILVDCGFFQGRKEEDAKNRRKAQIEGGKLDAVVVTHGLPIPETAVLIVGFQSPGTLGRKLVDGAKSLMMLGEEVPVRASIHTMSGFSAHADQTSRPRTIITHGEDRARKAFSELLQQRFGVTAERPALDDVIEI